LGVLANCFKKMIITRTMIQISKLILVLW